MLVPEVNVLTAAVCKERDGSGCNVRTQDPENFDEEFVSYLLPGSIKKIWDITATHKMGGSERA